MALENAMAFLKKVKNDEYFYRCLANAESAHARQRIIFDAGLLFTEDELNTAKSRLSDWDLTVIENESSFRSDKRISGLEFCCCCNVAGVVDEQ